MNAYLSGVLEALEKSFWFISKVLWVVFCLFVCLAWLEFFFGFFSVFFSF